MFQDFNLPQYNGRPLTKTQLKKLRRRGVDINQEQLTAAQLLHAQGLRLKTIKPKTRNQSAVFKNYTDGHQLMLHGYPGTGKTFLSLYLALSDVLETARFQKVVIVRSAVPSRDIGFLPGTAEEKMAQYELPYVSICTELFGRSDSYDQLKKKGHIEFIPTSYIRGITISNSIVIVDEAENLTFHELDSIITRLGDNSRIIFCGDYRQSDLKTSADKQGLHEFLKIINAMNCFKHVEMEEDDIVRSAMVKNYILTKAKHGLL